MKKSLVKILAATLAFAMVLPIAACNKKGSKIEKSRSGTKIAETDPWFESKIIEIKPDLKSGSKQVEYSSTKMAGIDDKYAVVYTNGSYKYTEETTDHDNQFNFISVVDINKGEVLKSFCLDDMRQEFDYFSNVMYKNGVISADLQHFNMLTYETTTISLEIDPETGKKISENTKEEDGFYYERRFDLGKYTIYSNTNWDENEISSVLTIKDSEATNIIELKKAGESIYYIPLIMMIDEKTALVSANTNSSTIYYEIDFNTFTAKEANAKDYEWLNANNMGSVSYDANGTPFFSSNESISKIDLKNKQIVTVFNYSYSTVKRNYLSYAEIFSCSDDKIVLGNQWYSSSYENAGPNNTYNLMVFTKAATNPHAGKTILELYAPYGYVDVAFDDAIIKFNSTNKDYFIEVADRYSSVDDVDYGNVNSEDDMQQANLLSNSKMSNQLAMDIMNGEGPDLLYNTFRYGQLNNSNYLVDLSRYTDSLDSTKYFTNVIDAAKIEGKLYQLPVSYEIEGIQTDPKYAGASGMGFTTEEYEEFLKKELNGQDIIPSGQAVYFATLYTAMSDKFIKDGKVDFSGPEFAALAEYVKNNVREKAKSWNEVDYGGGYAETYAVGALTFKGDSFDDQIALLTSIYGIGGYFMNLAQLKGDSTVLGYPSADGRGPLVTSFSSIAVSAQSHNVDACGEFVKILLSEEIQTTIGMNDMIPLNRDAFHTAGKAACEFYNSSQADMYVGYNNMTGEPLSNRRKYSQKDIDNFEKIIESCSCMNSSDAAINLILIEEMPAYFSGQKDLAAVVKIAQDRAQKVVSERG